MIALIGEKGLWRGFAPLGVKIFEIENKGEVLDSIGAVKAENLDFLFLSDYAANLIEDSLDDMYKEGSINIVILPSMDNSKTKAEQLYFKRMKSVVEKAMGVDLLSE